MALVDMQVQPVHGGGRAISGLSGDAGSAARSFLSAVTDAEGTVVHSQVSAALSRFHGTWSTPANRLAHDVDALGQNISGSAADVATGDQDASSAASSACTPNDALASRLNGGWSIGASGGASAGAGVGAGAGTGAAQPGGLSGSGDQGRYASAEAYEAGGDFPGG